MTLWIASGRGERSVNDSRQPYFVTFGVARLGLRNSAGSLGIDFEWVSSVSKFACLMCHPIGDSGCQPIVSEQQLRGQLAFLQSERYVVEGFRELEARRRSGEDFPVRYVRLTVDDGDASSMRASDIRADYGRQATFFITRDRSQKLPGFIRELEIRELSRRDFSLDTHGTGHRGLSYMPVEKSVAELRESKQWLEYVLGEIVRYMSAPFASIERRTLYLAHKQGCILVGSFRECMNSVAGISLPGRVDRVALRRHFSMLDAQSIVEGDLGFYLWRQARAAALAVPKRIFRV